MPKLAPRILIAALLVAAAALGVAALASAATTKRVNASKTQLKFTASTVRVSHGKVTLLMGNPSSTQHGIAIKGHGVRKLGKAVGKGGTSRVTVTLKKGTYEFFCPVDGHEAAGMKGKLIVQ